MIPGRLHRRALSGGEPEVVQDRFQRAERLHHAVFTRVIAHGANAPDFTVQRTKRGANFNAEIFQHQFAYLIAVDPVGDHHPQHVIHFVPQVAKGLEPHRLDALQQRIAVQFVAGDAVVESLLEDQARALPGGEQRRGRFGMVVKALRPPVIHHHAEIEIVGVDHLVDAIVMGIGADPLLNAAAAADDLFHPRAEGDGRGAGRSAQALLHPGGHGVQLPGVGFQRVTAERRGGVGIEQQGRRLAKAIEIVGFGDEEGTRFGITLLGSRGVTGTWPESWLSQCDTDGVSVAQALVNAGLDPARIAHAARHPRDIAAYLELHIEQGPCLEQAGLALGVVEAINGARRLNCRFTGEAGHAGTVPMLHRKDALAAAAEWMVQVENLTRQRGGNLVATVGTLRCAPGAVNVIPGEVQLTLDIRGPQDAPLTALLEELLGQAQAIAGRRQLSFAAEEYYRIAATACDSHLQAVLSEAVVAVQGRSLTLPSGAGHDAIAIAERWPSAMLFVRCLGGVSHHPAESVTAADVGLAIDAFSRAVEKVADA